MAVRLQGDGSEVKSFLCLCSIEASGAPSLSVNAWLKTALKVRLTFWCIHFGLLSDRLTEGLKVS